MPSKTVITEAEYQRHRDDYDGLCLACGHWTVGGVEPDARRYECPTCERKEVYGAEEVLMNGFIKFKEE